MEENIKFMNKKINKKKPPDKYKTFKISFKKLIKQNIDYSKLIYKYEKNKNAPIIDESFINLAFKCLRINGRGPKPKGTNLLIFKKLINDEKKEQIYHKWIFLYRFSYKYGKYKIF
ncbi:Hypothetical protein KVN_LOCUS174 [uncultured virus]|nr:Hypothetical protein KVN_LOCUS174 [uncultured virus]